MARTIKEIKKSMTDAFMADQTIRDVYGITGTASFEDTFSAVSIESILFYIVASAVYVLETLFDLFKKDVDDKVATAVLASIPWYHRICLEYQHGDALVFDETTQQYGYGTVDESKRLVRFAACRDAQGGVRVLVSGADASGLPEALSDDVLTPFKEYLNLRKPAGVPVSVSSYSPDEIKLDITVQYDPLVMNADGSLITDPSVFPAEDAVNGYVHGIVYGGVFNKTKLVDAMQSAQGVVDLILGEVSAKSSLDGQFGTVLGNNYTALSGSFNTADLKNTISYVLQL